MWSCTSDPDFHNQMSWIQILVISWERSRFPRLGITVAWAKSKWGIVWTLLDLMRSSPKFVPISNTHFGERFNPSGRGYYIKFDLLGTCKPRIYLACLVWSLESHLIESKKFGPQKSNPIHTCPTKIQSVADLLFHWLTPQHWETHPTQFSWVKHPTQLKESKHLQGTIRR